MPQNSGESFSTYLTRVNGLDDLWCLHVAVILDIPLDAYHVCLFDGKKTLYTIYSLFYGASV